MLHNNDNVNVFSLPRDDVLFGNPDEDYILPGGWHFYDAHENNTCASKGYPLLAFKRKRCTLAVTSDECEWKKADTVSV